MGKIGWIDQFEEVWEELIHPVGAYRHPNVQEYHGREFYEYTWDGQRMLASAHSPIVIIRDDSPCLYFPEKAIHTEADCFGSDDMQRCKSYITEFDAIGLLVRDRSSDEIQAILVANKDRLKDEHYTYYAAVAYMKQLEG